MAPNKKIAARRLVALAFFNDPSRVKLKPGADVSDLVTRYANMDRKPAAPKPAPSTAAFIREEVETTKCEDPTCEMPGTCGRTYGDWHAEGLRFGYRRGTAHTHTRIVPGLVRCPNCERKIHLRTWWNHSCNGRGAAAALA